MNTIDMYTTTWCPYCSQAKRLLTDEGLDWNEINIEQAGISRKELATRTGGFTVPQIVIGGKAIGGFTELFALRQSGKLSALVADTSTSG